MKAKPRPVSSRRRILTLPLRRWLSRTGSACSFRPRPEYRGRRATREARVSCSGPSRARRGDDDARLETRECESGDGVTGRACAGWGGLGQDAVRASDGSFKARGKERGKKRTFDRSRAGASPRSRVRRDSMPRPAGSAGRCARTRTRPRADRLRASARARARPAPGGALKKYIRIRAWRRDTWQTTKWKARMGRVPVGSRRGARPEGAGSDGAVSFASSCARAGSARACASRGVRRVRRAFVVSSILPY